METLSTDRNCIKGEPFQRRHKPLEDLVGEVVRDLVGAFVWFEVPDGAQTTHRGVNIGDFEQERNFPHKRLQMSGESMKSVSVHVQ